ncbi:MAG: spheroidene monooxygenase [Chitinophagaceae bacterium]|nr:spheroidene monooxygenase [Chitinophagaceae bacterium]
MVSLTIIKYKKRFVPFAFLAMAFFRIPLFFNKNISFWKLMGSGKSGSFDKTPDLQQWAIFTIDDRLLITSEKEFLYGNFIAKWLSFFKTESITYILEPIQGHGLWDGKKLFSDSPVKQNFEGKIAVLTRATIRVSKLSAFWKHVTGAAQEMKTAPGFILSYGIGEIPWIKQATFSIWENAEAMKNFAYKMHNHAEIIKKTRQQNWYSQDMYVRFKILLCEGCINGNKALDLKL